MPVWTVVVASMVSAGLLGAQVRDVRSGFVEVEGARVFYEAVGEGPALVLVHGGFMDRRMWDPQFEALSGEFTVIRYDARGAGRTETPSPAPYNPVADLLALLDHLRIERATVVGLSAGGFTAIDFALEHPERVTALVAAETAPSGFPIPPEIVGRMLQAFTILRNEGRDRAIESLLDQPVFATARDEPAVMDHLRLLLTDNFGTPVVALPAQPLANQRLGDLRMPVLTVVGGRSEGMAHDAAARMRERVPDIRVATIPGAGHMVNLEAPDEFNRVVVEFIAGLRSRE